jgi:hypothetical protein
MMNEADVTIQAPDDVELSDRMMDERIRTALKDLSNRSVTSAVTALDLNLEDMADLIGEPPVPPRWLIKGLLTEESGLGILGAEAKGAKTWMGLELMTALATATQAFGNFWVPKRVSTLGIFLEDGRENLKRRMAALAAGRGLKPEDLRGRIRFKCRPRIDLRRQADAAWIIAAARQMAISGSMPGLIYIDPLRKAHTAEENDSTEMDAVMNTLLGIADVTGALVLVPHHFLKPARDGAKSGRQAHKLRGSSAIHGAYDAGIFLEARDYMRTKTTSNWKIAVDVELRNAVPVPQFGAELDIVVDDGVGKRAVWVHHEDVNEMSPPKGKAGKPAAGSGQGGDDDEVVASRAKVLMALRGQYLRCDDERDAGMSKPEIYAVTGVPLTTIERRIEELMRASPNSPPRVQKVGRKFAYIPDPSEVSDSEDD